jgi:hypothetical protein
MSDLVELTSTVPNWDRKPDPIPGAVLSADRIYRYSLVRKVEPMTEVVWARPLTFIMLNPSTADENENDPTIRKCMGYAARWGFRHVIVVNLFAYRATQPDDLKIAVKRGADIIGRENWWYTRKAVDQSQWVVCGWGNHGKILNRGKEVHGLLAGRGIMLRTLKLTGPGQPWHPLYLKWDIKPAEWATCAIAEK